MLGPVVLLGRRYTIPATEPQRSNELYRLLGLLVEENKRQMRARGTIPPPAIAVRGLRYQMEPPGQERWQTAEDLWTSKRGDCEDLACYEAARLQLAGVNAKPALIQNSIGYHCVVGIANVAVGYGKNKSITWDPSEALGMNEG